MRKGKVTREIISPYSLNQDCWLLICDLLTYKDILNLAKISKGYTKYLQLYVLPLRFKTLKIDFPFPVRYDFGRDLRFFLESISHTVERVYLWNLPLKHFELLKSFRFPCVTHMSVTVARKGKGEYMKELSSIFPNVRILFPEGGWGFCNSDTIGLLTNFRYLENLILTDCACITEDDFRHILLALNLKILELGLFRGVKPLNEEEQLKFSQLQEIKLSSEELCWIINTPINFQNLKLLSLDCFWPDYNAENVDNLFRNIERIVPRNVYEMELACYKDELLYELMDSEKYEYLNRVHTLKFRDVDVSLNIFSIPGTLKALRRLYFMNCYAEWDENIALKIMKNYEELRFLSFEGYSWPDLNETHLKTLEVRKIPITLNWCLECWEEEEDTQSNCFAKYEGPIKFTQRKAYGDDIDSDFIAIRFK